MNEPTDLPEQPEPNHHDQEEAAYRALSEAAMRLVAANLYIVIGPPKLDQAHLVVGVPVALPNNQVQRKDFCGQLVIALPDGSIREVPVVWPPPPKAAPEPEPPKIVVGG